ncbi:MAG: serine hydrolase [Gemmatimonadaceae bacterium]|nr:serine hydrolase [Gemmatimonadaceae bacterium]
MRHRTSLLAAALALVPALPAQRVVSAPPADLDTYVEQVMRTFDVPGMAVSIVKDGKVLVGRGYGVRTLGDTARVTPGTRFGIASNSKAFTATALAMLVDEGKVEWDVPVVTYLPQFALSDPYVTRQITVRDLLVHRSGLGLGAGDLLWWPASTYNRKQIMHRLRDIPLSTSFRSAYAYDNVLYLVAGEVIEAVSGQVWEDFIATRLLAPLGMTGTTTRHSDAARSGNVATTHAMVDGRLQRITPLTSDNTNPAGGINTSAADIAKWMIAQLDSGRTGSTRLWSQRAQRNLWTGVTPTPIRSAPPGLAAVAPQFSLYALGFNVQDYRGRKIATHTGGLPGYVSQVTFVPSLKLGVSVLTNQESADAFQSITQRVLDHFMGAAPVDWRAVMDSMAKANRARSAAQVSGAAAARDSLSKPSLPIERYAGEYEDSWYGRVSITTTAGRLGITMRPSPDLVGELQHWQYDTFVVRWKDRALRADAFITFQLAPDGSVENARMAPFTDDVDFSFDFQDLRLKRLPP